MKYFLVLTFAFTFCLFSCSNDPESQPEANTNTDTNTETNDDGNSDDTGGEDPGGDVVDDPQCEYLGGNDYNLIFGVEDEYAQNYNVYVFDENWNVVDQKPLINNADVSFNFPDSANDIFHVLVHEYGNPGVDMSDATLLLEMPPGEYIHRKFTSVMPSPEREILSFPINNIGTLPFQLRNWNMFVYENFYSSNNGGTYFFGQDGELLRSYYPDHKGFFLSFRANDEQNDRYFWSETPGYIQGLNFNNLPTTNNIIDITLDPIFLNNDITNLWVYGFVPNNDSPYFGNQIGRFSSSLSSNIAYSVPDNIFNRYRYELKSYNNCYGCTVYYISRNVDQPVESISFPNWSYSVTTSTNVKISATTTGDYDAFMVSYSRFDSQNSIIIFGPRNEQNLIDFTLPSSVISIINSDFNYFEASNIALMSYEETECYGSFLKTHLSYYYENWWTPDHTKQATLFY